MKAFGFLLASAILAVSASSQEIEAYSSGGYNVIPGLNSDAYVQMHPRARINSSHSRYMYHGGVGNRYNQGYRGYWNGNEYRPGYSYDAASGWNRQQFQAGSFWYQNFYVPPHLNERIR